MLKGDQLKKAKSILLVFPVSILMMEAVSFSSAHATIYLPLIWNQVKTGVQTGQWISLQALTTESQWTAQTATPNKDWIYLEAAVVLDYLITQKGVSQAKAVLTKVGSGIPFADAFQQVFSRTVDQLEAEFIAYLISH